MRWGHWDDDRCTDGNVILNSVLKESCIGFRLYSSGQEREQRRDFVKTVMDFQVPYRARNSFD
jgi:hypothetical protein